MSKNSLGRQSGIWVILLLILSIGVFGLLVWVFRDQSPLEPVDREQTPVVKDFNSCVSVGGRVLESQPRACLWDQVTFLEPGSEEVVEKPTEPNASLLLKLYFTSEEVLAENCGGTVEVARRIPWTAGVGRAALLELFKGPTPEERAAGLQSSFQGFDRVLKGVNIQADGTFTVDFTSEVLNPEGDFWLGNFGTTCGSGAWQQIRLTLRQFATVKYIVFTVEGSVDPWNRLINLRGCPVEKSGNETEEDFLQAKKQCAQS